MALDSYALRGDPSPGDLKDPLTTPYVVGAGSDAVDLPFKPRAMHVSVAGNIKYTAGGVTVALEAFEVGWHPCRMDRIWATGLTATVTVWK